MSTEYNSSRHSGSFETQSDSSRSARPGRIPGTASLEKRLQSLENLPAPHNVYLPDLAKYGFFYKKAENAVKCHGCRNIVREWNIGDNPDDKRFHKDGCQFVKGPDNSVNGAVASPAENMEEDIARPYEVPAATPAPVKFIPQKLRVPPNLFPVNTESTVSTAGSDISESSFTKLTPLSELNRRRSDESQSSSPLPNFNVPSKPNGTVVRPIATNGPLHPETSTSEDLMRNMTTQIGIASLEVDVLQNADMKEAKNRLQTFKRYWLRENNFRNIHLLVSCGFFCLGQGDAVQCFCCNEILANWTRNDDPRQRHAECSPNCRFIMGERCGDVPLPVEARRERTSRQGHNPSQHRRRIVSNASLSQPNSSSQVDVAPSPPTVFSGNSAETFTCSNPANPYMREFQVRLLTFANPRFRNNTQLRATNEDLAQAGLYYSGNGDRTKCWCCGGGLKDYELHDDPWVEHAKYFPNCDYLKQQRGPAWVSSIVRQFPDIQRPVSQRYENNSLPHNVVSPPMPPTAPSSRIEDPQGMLETREQILEAAMQTSPVESARDMGFSDQLIRDVQMRFIILNGCCYQSREDLLEALLHPEREAERREVTPPRPRNTIDLSGRTITIRGGNFVGPSIIDGHLYRPSSSSGESILIDGMPAEEYQDYINQLRAEQEHARQPAYTFNNVGNRISTRGFANATTSNPRSTVETRTTEDRLDALEREQRCKICLSEPADILFQPCGHLCACAGCAFRLKDCPLCRRGIGRQIKIYHS